MAKKSNAYSPEFILVEWFIICSDEERFDHNTSLQKILGNSLQPWQN
jgi:hypothetical protein